MPINFLTLFLALLLIELLLIAYRTLRYLIDKYDLLLIFRCRPDDRPRPSMEFTDYSGNFNLTELPVDLSAYFKDKHFLLIGGDLRSKYRKLIRSASKVTSLDLVTKRNIFRLIYDSDNTNKMLRMDGGNLSLFPDDSFDGVASSHLIEHLANPIKAILEWARVTKVGGLIHIALPHKDFTFDRKRELTPISHLIRDYSGNIKQDDTTHRDEFINLWDETMDYCFTRKQFNRNMMKFPHIFVHHHVFNERSFCELINLFNSFKTVDFYGKEDTIYWSGELIKKPQFTLPDLFSIIAP